MPSDQDKKPEVSAQSKAPPTTMIHSLLTRMQGEKQFSIQPVQESGQDPKFAPFSAHPGPAQPASMPAQEGTKEDRQAKKEALNKK